jgi:hypothetical protein
VLGSFGNAIAIIRPNKRINVTTLNEARLLLFSVSYDDERHDCATLCETSELNLVNLDSRSYPSLLLRTLSFHTVLVISP